MEDLFSAAQNQMMQNQMMQSQCNMQDPMMSGQYGMQDQYCMQNQYGMQNPMMSGQYGMQNPMMSGQYGMQNQMYQDPYSMQNQMYQDPYSMQNQMCQNPVGTVDRYGMVRYNKAQYLTGLRDFVIRNCGGCVTINKEEKLEDIPEKLRHCCANSKSKIVLLDKMVFYVQETGMSIPFYFCMDCGKLFYYKDFMV